MNNEEKKATGSQKKEFFLKRWLKRLFFPQKEIKDIYTEEKLETPTRVVFKNFFSRPLPVISLIIFIIIALFVFIAPSFVDLDLGEQDSTLVYIAPGYDMMNYPSELEANGVRDIAVGYNYSVGVDNNGNVYVWGKHKVSKVVDIAEIPEEVKNAKIVKVAAGFDHVLALDDQGVLYAWGNKRNKQLKLPEEIVANNKDRKFKIEVIRASNQFSAVVTSEHKLYMWGNSNNAQNMEFISSEIEGHVADAALTLTDCVILTTEGQVRSPFSFDSGALALNIPESLASGVKSIAASATCACALKEDGNIVVWGAPAKGEDLIPISIAQTVNSVDGKYSYSAKIKDGTAVSWNAISDAEGNLIVFWDAPVQVKKDGIADFSGKKITPVDGKYLFTTQHENGSIFSWAAIINSDGDLVVCGALPNAEHPGSLPKVAELKSGRHHYTVRLEDGSVISWGSKKYKQCVVPANIKDADIQELHVGSFQNYAVDKDGNIHTWGLKGFLMGTDKLGRDVFSRLVNGGKMTMTIGAVAVIIAVIIGIILGGLAGYFGGTTDIILERLAEIVGSLPFLPFCMILSAVMGQLVTVEFRMYIIMVILGVLSWPGMFYLVRAQIFREREQEYVLAAKALGLKQSRIVFKHIIPNVMSVCLVSITLSFGSSMLQEASLSYLGFGVPLPTPTWGNMLNGANESKVIQQFWWNWVFVGAIFSLTCICINLIGDGIRDALDPKTSGR